MGPYWKVTYLTCVAFFISSACGVVNEKWLQTIMTHSSDNEKIIKVLQFSVEPAFPNGTNYGSNVERVHMKVMHKSGKKSHTSILVYGYPTTPFHKQNIKESGMFKTSIEVYRDVLPRMEQIIHNAYDNSEPMWIKYIDLIPFYQITLEDVSMKGYSLKNKMEGLDLDHCELAMTTLAKFHAISAILGQEQSLPRGQIDQPLLIRNKDKIGNFYEVAFNNLAESIKSNWDPEWQHLVPRVERRAKAITQELLKLSERNNTNFNVLVHGSYYINNIFFSYGISDVYQSPAPIAAKFNGFQTAFFNSPVHDLQFFLNTSPEETIILNQRDHLVEVYHYSLTRYLSRFKYSSPAPSLEMIQSELKRTDLIGLAHAVNHLHLLYLKPEDIPDFEKDFEKTKMTNQISYNGKGMLGDKYKRVLQKLLTKAVENGVI